MNKDNDNEKKSVWQKIKENKWEIIVMGVGLAVGGILVYKNKNFISRIFDTKIDVVEKDIVDNCINNIETMVGVNSQTVREIPGKVISISEHIRKLPSGHHVSSEKIAEAAAKGIELPLDTTLVSSYTKSA